MQSEDRLIHFSTELLHPPTKHTDESLRKLYFELSQRRETAYKSSDFNVAGQVRFQTRSGERTQSVAIVLPDRVAVAEEWTLIPMSEFYTKVETVGECALSALNVANFVAQTATVRATFALTHYEDARVFLLDHVCKQSEKISPFFQRPIGVGGLRFVLPETEDHPGNLHVLIESYKHSRNEIFVEAKSIFLNRKIGREDLSAACENIKQVRSFISDCVHPFLDQYDVPPKVC